jgi:hypothetical protein
LEAVVEQQLQVEMAVLHGEVVNLVNLELWVTEGTVDFTQLLLAAVAAVAVTVVVEVVQTTAVPELTAAVAVAAVQV